MWIYPLLLAVPNVALAFTEQGPVAVKLAGIALPLGIYYIIMSSTYRTGLAVWMCLPLTFFAAFQVVLLFLYGESIIAVDMFLNVATTNVGEATELLGNLWPALTAVGLLYVLPLIWATVLLCRRARVAPGRLRPARMAGVMILAAGLALWWRSPGLEPTRDIFPVNVIDNMCTAVARTRATALYTQTSAGFRYGASSLRPDSLREIHVLVVGETGRADHWQLLGYNRPTNPRLSRRAGLCVFSHVLSESNTTHKSVPLALSHLTAAEYGDSIYLTRGIVSAMNEAGYRTAWLSAQARNHSLIDLFAAEADTVDFIGDEESHPHDIDLTGPLARLIAGNPAGKLFVVLHTYGSHFNYRDRYPERYARFTPDFPTEASADNRPTLINAYDNSILHTDAMLDSVICILDACRCPASLTYFSDHGEDIYDDPRGRFLHASPTPTVYQLHVPMAVWTSDSLAAIAPGLRPAMRSRRDAPVSSSASVFHTLLTLAGVDTPYLRTSLSVAAPGYRPRPALYVTDRNVGVPLGQSGLREPDFIELERRHLNENATLSALFE